MRLMEMKCPACGGVIGQKITSRMVTCEYCGSRFVLDDDEADIYLENAAAFEEEEEDYETSDLSMAEFAVEACEGFLNELEDDDSFRSSPKILRGLGVSDGDEVYLIHDDTLFKSGKNGFAITDRGLYCREMSEQAVFYDWSSFAKMYEPDVVDSYIKCGNKSVCYFTDDSDLLPELCGLYRRLHAHATHQA